MTSTYHSSSFSRFLIDLNQDHDHQQLLLSPSPDQTASVPSLAYPIFINPTTPLQEERGYYQGELQPILNQHKDTVCASHGGSSSFDHHPRANENDVSGVKLSVSKKEDRNLESHSSEKGSDKWISSKIRLMKKMMISDQTVADAPVITSSKLEDHKDLASPSSQTDNSISSNISPANSTCTIRVCADCNTTKTPLWRSGPKGPKSLCNACGIRQRKARRAMAAAAAAANGTIFAPDTTPKVMKAKVQHKEKKTGNNSHLPFKKRCKFTSQARGRKEKLCFEDLRIILNKNSALHQRVFPQDEKEAAILLMALSYGLVHG
ncbi:hypothetical protein Tsubulata_028620 [Turnera subulata]|uniref:GATA-type domain-containing protein n=1 Tax=Turnera subulata TaxID=218843 RepID=A0A9Q0J9Q9_9ROSI|nr:hypothetical protein Tsubulata_028620 [Turnera subulata]